MRDERDTTSDADYVHMHESEMAKLKACPFCGGKEFASGSDKGVLQWIVCYCGAAMGEPGENPETPIVESWNNRVVEERTARLRAVCNEWAHWWTIMREAVEEPQKLRDPWEDAFQHLDQLRREWRNGWNDYV